MWSIVLPDNTALDGVPDLNFELNSPIFSTSDATVLPGSFTFPFDVPLTPRNRVALGHPNLVNNAAAWRTYPGTWVLLYGAPVFYGTLTIRTCTPTKVSLTVVANPVERLRETLLTELDLGGDRAMPANLLTHMDTVASTPSAYDYAFFPVAAPDGAVQNKFSTTTGLAVSDTYATTPFVKLIYLLNAAFTQAATGFHFVNSFQLPAIKELNWLYLYNNKDLRVSDGATAPVLPTTFNLQQHVPRIKVPEMLKNVCGLFNLGLFANVFERTLVLEPIESILSRSPRLDWTNYQAGEMAIDSSIPPPNYYNYGAPGGTPPPDFPEMENAPRYRNEGELDAAFASGTPPGYGSYEDVFVRRDALPGGGYVGVFGTRRSYGVKVGTGTQVPYDNNCAVQPCAGLYTTEAVSKYEGLPADTPTQWTYKAQDFGFSLMLYRGRQSFTFAGNRPWASSNVWQPIALDRYDLVENGVTLGKAEYALHWDGEYGLFNRWHRRWQNMLATGKPVVQQFIVPLQALLNFSFRDKIVVGSMEYVPTKLRVQKAVGQGKVLIELNLISVI